MKGESGQATVELVFVLPLVLLVAVAGAALLAAEAATEQAGMAAEAGAIAIVNGDDPRAAARRALPDDTHARIDVHGRRITIHVRPHVVIRSLGRLLTATATADAGAAP
jgi:hypothetical protein